jgi:small-conductance mechanosensitive channel
MMNKIFVFSCQVATAVAFWIADFYHPEMYFRNGFYTFLALAVIYLVFKLVLEHLFARRIKDSKTKYSFKKVISIIYVVVFAGVVIQIWVTNTDAMLVSYGLLAAGIAVSLQDLFKDFVGGIIIFTTGLYRVGDRIEIESTCGDVIDIGILYTTLLEIQEWVKGDQATGRLTVVPNGYVLSKAVNNYTKDHNFIWDEIVLPITYDSDWKIAKEKLISIGNAETSSMAAQAETEMSSIMEKYYFSKREVEPRVFLALTDNWISLTLRYITDVRKRRAVRDRLYQHILKEVEGSGGAIRIASESTTITNLPGPPTKQGSRRKGP